MFEAIIQQVRSSKYDFRATAYSADPLAHLFIDWVDYYRLKWAIAHVLKPASILEIGVRFGYSAAAFLSGVPTAHYVGIDLDVDTFGGTQGAINWAKKITQPFSADFIVADTQTMEWFPGDIYDLVHVDGQQDGDGTFHDLELALKQARYVLVDGYLWTRQNFTAVNDFLLRYSDLFDWYGVIPGYAGELLIKVSEDYLVQVQQRRSQGAGSLSIRETYTTGYYLQDCGGYDVYKRHQGKQLADPRLQATATIAGLRQSGRVLDLGCGRGELSYYFANQGFSVTSVDYSQSAIDLAEKCFDGDDQLRKNVEFICDDVCKVALTERYDLAIASDLIEHLSFDEVNQLYQKVADQLNPSGLLIIHTFPNLWHYKYDYVRKRKIAASVGAYLPPEPRSRYELLMHINEQSPRVMKRQLSQHFKHLHLWFGSHDNPGGSLTKKFSIRELASAPSLFAVASHQAIDLDALKSRLEMSPLSPISGGQLRLLITDFANQVKADREFEVQLALQNNSEFVLHSYGSHPVHIAYHWLDSQTHDSIVFDGERTRLFPILDRSDPKPQNFPAVHQSKKIYRARVKALPVPGRYILRMTLVQEGVRWFDQAPTQMMQDVCIEVT